MQAIILAGGAGTRLHPLTTNLPKPMVPLFDRPVLDHCVRLLSRHKITDILITTSSAAPEIVDYFGDGSAWGVNIRYSIEEQPLGTAGALKLVQDQVKDTFLVVSGDTVTDADLTAAIEWHKSASAIATLLLYKADDPSQFGMVEHDASGKITRFIEKPGLAETTTNTINTGIYILEPEVLSCIPYYRTYDLCSHLIPAMLNNREPVYGMPLPGYWCDVGDMMQYRACHFDALTGKIKLDLPAVHVGDGVWLGQDADVHSSVQLASPVFLGDGVVVRRDTILDGCTVVGAGSHIGANAYLARTVIGGNSFIKNESRITDTIIGSGFNAAEAAGVYGKSAVLDSEKQKPAVLSALAQEQQQTMQ